MKLKNLSRLTALLLAFILCFSTVAEAAVPLSDLTTYGLLDGFLEMLGIKRVYGCLDYPLTLTFDKSLDDGEYTYQWYKITGFNSSETVPSDATPSQLTIKPTTSTEYYYCIATNDSTGAQTRSSAFVVAAYGPDDAVEYLKVLSHIRSVVYPGDKMPYRVEAHKYMTESWNTAMDGQNLAQAILTASTTSTDYPNLLCTCCIAADGSISDEILLHPYVAHAKGCPWEDYIIQLPIPPQPKLYYGDPQGEQYTANSSYGLPMTKAIILPAGGSATVSVSGSSVSAQARGVTSPTQWQVYNGSEWANMLGETSDTLVVTTAKLQTIFNLTGVAHLRYYDRTNDVVLGYVDVTPQANAGEYPEETEQTLFVESRGMTVQSRDGTYTVVVNFVFENNVVVATPYTANLAAGSNFKTTVTFPTVQGYLPYLDNVQQDSLELNYTGIDQNYTYNVVYKPTNVEYVVRHYKQNAENDGYTLAEPEVKTQGLTNSQVPDVAHIRKVDDGNGSVTTVVDPGYDGFYALQYERPLIAADGSTEVEVYYDRYYYLMNFDLDGGYGVEPIYARYGAPISGVGTPEKAGYTFVGWAKVNADGTTTVVDNLPDTMPAGNSTYKALWEEANSSFTVVYWLENADDDNYSVFGSTTVVATTGDAVTDAVYNSVDYKDYQNANITLDSNMQELVPFIDYGKADASVTVAGDKSSIVNVYYKRQKFTLKFYYAMDGTSNGITTHYVIGGSTYAFGYNEGDAAVSADKITTYYMDGGTWVNNRGQVDEVPTPNDIGSSRGYTLGDDTATKSYNGNTYNYKYYYISFKAKYGADISELWPCNVFNSVTRTSANTGTGAWTGTEAFVSAWNGEYRVKYTQDHQGNQTIKGNYNKLDTQLLWDSKLGHGYADTDYTVDFLCFWENGANIGWSVPELYRYMVWVPMLDDQANTGLTTKTVNGVEYYLRNTYDTVDDSDVKNQTAPAIKGLTYTNNINKDKDPIEGVDYNKITDFDSSLYREAYEVNFFYTRNLYNLTFRNDGNEEKTEQVYFEAPLTDKSFEPSYPTSLEAGGYKFEGWYTSPTCEAGTKFDFEKSTMPANDLLLYANWVPVSHKVEFYLDKAALDAGTKLSTHPDITVPHGTKADPVPADPTNGSYTFVGWFHMENGVEKAFDFANMPVNKDLQVYGKWSSNVLKQYTIYYKYKDTDGNEIEIAAPTTGSGLAGTTKTFEAKGGADLYAGYQEGYFPVVKSHSMTIDINATEENDTNVYTFWYVQKDAVPYIVRYVDEAGNVLHVQKVVADNRKAVVTEKYQLISGYLPDEYQKRLVVTGADVAEGEEWISVTVDGTEVLVHPDNVLTFVYTKDTEHAYWTITHYTENLGTDADGNPTWTEYSHSEAVGTIDQSYTATPMTIPGFTYDPSVAGTMISGKLTEDGLDLKLYYIRNSYPYQVRYLEQGTNKQLADPKNGTGKYGQVISESAIDITNYTAVDPTSQTLNIRIEESTEAKLNIITFYYTENEATINYVAVGPEGLDTDGKPLVTTAGTVTPTSETLKVLTGTAQGSTATASSNTYKFVGWYSDAACTTPVDASWVDVNNKIKPVKDADAAWTNTTYYAKFVVDKAKLTIVKTGMDSGESAIFNVNGPGFNGKVVVQTGKSVELFVTCGEYTITEVGAWSNRYTTTVTGLTDGKVELTAAGATVSFTNTKKNDKWLHDESSVENFKQTPSNTGN